MAKPKADELDKLAAEKVRETYGALTLDQAREVVLAQVAADDAAAAAAAAEEEAKAKAKKSEKPEKPEKGADK